MARALVGIDGVVGVTLGGSRARGTADEHSDVDLGVYYRGDLDVPAVRALARRHDPGAEVSERGGWGPWVDGGAWLTVGGTRVDWIYRDLDRVERIRADCEQGRVDCHAQIGHPHGFWTSAYVAELALARILADPAGALDRARPTGYPDALRTALSGRGRWEAGFVLAGAEKGADRGDVGWVAGCLYRAVGCLSQARHAEAGEWVTTEKGTIAPDLAALLAHLGSTPAELHAAIDRVRDSAQNGGQGIAGQSPDGSG
jgi:predicted nucleotidyltransferase